MGTLCIESTKNCSPQYSLNFGGRIPLIISLFESRILKRHFGNGRAIGLWQSLELMTTHSSTGTGLHAWSQLKDFHSYLTESLLCTHCSVARTWQEYLRWPTPMTTPQPQPINNLDIGTVRAILSTKEELPLYMEITIPVGDVTHYIYSNQYMPAFINVTNPNHMFYPGYVVRWLTRRGNAIFSNTLGRGIGEMRQINEAAGARVFLALDQRIKRRLEQTDSQ